MKFIIWHFILLLIIWHSIQIFFYQTTNNSSVNIRVSIEWIRMKMTGNRECSLKLLRVHNVHRVGFCRNEHKRDESREVLCAEFRVAVAVEIRAVECELRDESHSTRTTARRPLRRGSLCTRSARNRPSTASSCNFHSGSATPTATSSCVGFRAIRTANRVFTPSAASGALHSATAQFPVAVQLLQSSESRMRTQRLASNRWFAAAAAVSARCARMWMSCSLDGNATNQNLMFI